VALAFWKRALVRASAASNELPMESAVRQALVRAEGHGRPSIWEIAEIVAERADLDDISSVRRASRFAAASSQTALSKESLEAASGSNLAKGIDA
jgi:hypothetical protein